MRRHPISRSALLAAGLVLVSIGLAAGPAAAAVGPRDGDRSNRRIAVGDVNVVAGETVDGPLVAIDGRAAISGTVDGDAFVVRGDLVLRKGGEIDGTVIVARGDATIHGTVDGDVVVLGGKAVVGGSATVDGDVVSTQSPRVAGGAKVTGDVQHVNIPRALAALGFGLLLFWWFAVTVSTAILGALLLALVPRGMEAAAATGRSKSRWWVALLVGLGLVVALPILGVVAVSSLIGLPFGLGLLGALGLVHAIGYVAGAFFLGRSIVKAPRNRFGAFFVGWGILRLVALLPVLGALAWVVAAVYGIGMLAVAGFRAGQPARDGTDEPASPPPAAPEPETTSA